MAQFNQPEFPGPSGDAGHFSHAQSNMHVEAQVTPSDASQAHQFFQAKGTGGLPDVQINSAPTGAEHAALTQAAPASVPTGAEHAIVSQASAVGHAAIGHAAAGHAAIGAAAAAGEPISPIIQLIMKMPGLTGVMNSFFEFLGALFHGQLLDAFNPVLWAEQAASALHSLATGHLAIPIDILPSTSPLLSFTGHGFMSLGSGGFSFNINMLQAHNALPQLQLHEGLGDPFQLSSPADAQNAIFERTSNFSTPDYHQNSLLANFGQPEHVALGGDAPAYRPAMGGYYQSVSPASSSAPAAPVQQAAQPHVQAQPSAHMQHATGHHHGAFSERGSHLSQFRTADVSLGSPDKIAQAHAPEAADGGTYTVKSGDNLWDIARHQLGDGSRWREIYHANADVVGANPDLIHPGTTLHLPGAQDIAQQSADAGKYVVQPGDNLWSIAQHHMGGGQHWGQIYHSNMSVIGADPRHIMPGQELSLSSGSEQIAAMPQAQPSLPSSDISATHAAEQALAAQHTATPINVAHTAPEHSVGIIEGAPHQHMSLAQTTTHHPMSPINSAPTQTPAQAQMGGALTPVTDHTAVNSTSVPTTATDTPVYGGTADAANFRRDP